MAQDKLGDHLERIITVSFKTDTSKLLLSGVLPMYTSLDSSDVFYDFARSNYNYSYTLMNYALKATPQELSFNSLKDIDSVVCKVKKEYIERLMVSEEYTEALKYYLGRKHGVPIEAKYSIQIDQLVGIASKYYFVYKLEADSIIKSIFCGGGANPYLLMPDLSTNIISESFAFQALGQLLAQGNFDLIKKLKKEIEPILLDTLRSLPSKMSHEDKLSLLREITWSEMEKDVRIKEALLAERNRSGNIIPLNIVLE